MPIFNAGRTPYPLDDIFSPEPTYKGASVPDYGFYFAVPKDSAAQCPFDGCVDYQSFLFKKDIEKKHYLLMRYELLYQYKAEHRLAGEFYTVPWLLVPSDFTSDKVIELTVSAYSIYDTVTKELTDKIDKDLERSGRQIELSVPNTSAITAYWGESGTDTTIEEKKFKKQRVRTVTIQIKAPTPSAPYVSDPKIEHRQDILIKAGSSVLGKLRLTFCKPLSQDVCFIRVTQPTLNGKFEAKILSLSEIPPSIEDGATTLDNSLIQALKPYCIDIVSLKDAEFLDANGNVLISTQTSLSLGADLKPSDPQLKDPESYIDKKLADALFSKLKTYKFAGTAGGKAIQKVLVVVILPFSVDSRTSGFTPKVDRTVTLNMPLRSYLYPLGTVIYEQALKDQALILERVREKDPLNRKWTVAIKVPNPYTRSTLVHEILHALQLRHTFLDKNDPPQKEYLSDFARGMKTKSLTEFGDRDPGPTPAGGNIFELMRDADLNSAAVTQYLWGVLQLPNFNPQTPVSPAPPEGWNFMVQLNNSVLFPKYATGNFLDYKNDQSDLDMHSDPVPIDNFFGTVFVSIRAIPRQFYLFRYQWELARATVQYLSSYP